MTMECSSWNGFEKRYIYVLNDDVEDGVTLEAPAVQPEVVIQPEDQEGNNDNLYIFKIAK